MRKKLGKLIDSPLIDWPLATLLGVGFYFAWSRWIPLGGTEPIPESLFAVSTVLGTMAGFLSAGLLFVAGVDNSTMRRIRVEHGERLNKSLLGGTVALLISALGMAACGLLSDGWCARIFALGLIYLSIVKLARVGVILHGVLATVNAAATDAMEGSSQVAPDAGKLL